MVEGSGEAITDPAWREVFHALTFELSRRRWQAARPRLARMYPVPPARAWRLAVGAPLECGVKHHRTMHVQVPPVALLARPGLQLGCVPSQRHTPYTL